MGSIVLDTTIDCSDKDSAGVKDKGVGKIGIASSPHPLDLHINASGGTIGITSAPTSVLSVVIVLVSSEIGIKSAPLPLLEPIEYGWVWTSKIGSMDFTEDLGGEVTKQPMSWYGYVYKILQCSVGAVVYGKNGITLMVPSGVAWGKKELYPIGIKGQNAAVSTKRGQFSIDRMGRLVHIADNGQVQVTDYSNYFSALATTVVMSYDEAKDIIYISDGTYGYVLTQWGLGKGPINITGMGNKSGTLYAIAPIVTITIDALSVVTDILDFGTRTEKIISEVQVGTDTTKAVQVAVDYRWNKADAFYTSPWVTVDREGRAFITVSGVEFKMRVKLASYEAMEIDYIKVIGLTADEITGTA